MGITHGNKPGAGAKFLLPLAAASSTKYRYFGDHSSVTDGGLREWDGVEGGLLSGNCSEVCCLPVTFSLCPLLMRGTTPNQMVDILLFLAISDACSADKLTINGS